MEVFAEYSDGRSELSRGSASQARAGAVAMNGGEMSSRRERVLRRAKRERCRFMASMHGCSRSRSGVRSSRQHEPAAPISPIRPRATLAPQTRPLGLVLVLTWKQYPKTGELDMLAWLIYITGCSATNN